MKPERKANVVLSNRWENLAERLKERLFFSGSLPFERRLVIVPSQTVKAYLLQNLARDSHLQIAAGIQILSLQHAASLFSVGKIPTQTELSLKIEHEIHSLDFADPLFEPLAEYLGKATGGRLSPLSDRLSHLFTKYGLYGGAFLAEWLKEKGWRQALWTLVFREGWTYPYRLLEESRPFEGQIHLFGFSFLPRLYQQFFKTKEASFYFSSPCQYFWGDLSSDKERLFLLNKFKGQQEELESYLKEQHSFLANWGKAGRDTLKLAEDEECIGEECYEENPGESSLHRLQNDFLNLEQTENEKDNSIQVHSATSKMREVEVLSEAVRELIDAQASEKEPIYPKDIVIAAPDINDYAPYIHMVFGKEKNGLDYKMTDLEMSSVSRLAQGLEILLSLHSRRFEVEAVMKLLTFSNFLEKFALSENDAATLSDWIGKAHVRWGLDADYRQKMRSVESGSRGSWEHGLDRLLLGLAYAGEESEYLPCVAWSEIGLLEKWIGIIRLLTEDLKPIIEEKKETASFWMRLFKRLAQTYFKISAKEDEELILEMERLGKEMSQLGNPCFSFGAMYRILETIFRKKTASFHSSHLQAVRFGSISPGCMAPAQIVCLLGMSESGYPRLEEKNSLCEMGGRKADFRPTKGEEDRYLFLELLLAARRALVITYSRIHPEDHKEQEPSSVVQWEAVVHPSLPFDKSYFSAPSHLSMSHYLSAKAFYLSPKNKDPFIPEFYFEKSSSFEKRENEIVVDIKHLKALAKHPIKFYFQRKLNIYLSNEDEEAEKEFDLSYLDLTILRDACLKKDPEAVIQQAAAQGKLPLGPFGEAARLRLVEKIEEFQEQLLYFGVGPKEIFSVEFHPGCTAPEQIGSRKILPPLSIPLEQGRRATLIGKLDGLTPQGLLFSGEHLFKDWIAARPLYLIMLALSECSPQILFTKKGQKKPLLVKEPLLELKRYIDYYELALEQASPLMPTWSKPLFNGDVKNLEKAVRSREDHDPYLKWLRLRDALPDPQVLCANWTSRLVELFPTLLEEAEG